MSRYIASADYATYGLTAGAATDQAVAAASSLIDAHLGRPEGLVWTKDPAGQPCFMAGAVPVRTWAIQSDIMPGAKVTVALDSPPSANILGEALVLDAPTPAYCEAVVVTGIDGNNVTFDSVSRNHSATSPLALGLVISERRLVGYQCPVAFLTRTPIVRVVAVGSRWDASSRREPSLSDNHHEAPWDFGTGIGAIPQPGRPPQWGIMDPLVVDYDPDTGKLLVHAISARNEVKACYLAGWDTAALPEIIKQACLRLTNAILSMDPDIPANAKLYKAGDTAIQRFANTLIDEDTRLQLKPFAALRGL